MKPLTRLGVPKLWREDDERFWRFMHRVISPIVLGMAPAYGYGAERIPAEGAVLLAANHFSGIDHPLIGSFSPRPVYFMAKAELLARPVVGEFITWTGAFPVRRGEADREALRAGRELIREGKVVGVHVEGTRQRFGHPGPVHTGGMMIAMLEHVPVLPCAVDTFGWSPRNRRRCAVVFGELLSLEGLPRGREGYRQGAEIVGAEIVRLWRQAIEAVAAGFPEELPDGARRSGIARPGRDSLSPVQH